MTNEEALEILCKGIAPNPKANDECIKLCKEAIKKQMSQKPICTFITSGDIIIKEYHCPNCTYSSLVYTPNYCLSCGQKLNWKEMKY